MIELSLYSGIGGGLLGSHTYKKRGRCGRESLASQVNASGGIETQQKGSLNPDWTEWLMGYPIGWTDLKELAAGKFQRWLGQHGNF